MQRPRWKRLADAWWLLVVAVLVGALLWLTRQNRCQRRCNEAVEGADRRATAGDLIGALTILDRVDAACDCGRFTEGDEPPEYAAARFYLEELRRGQGEEALSRLEIRGPILRDLLGKSAER